MSVVIAYKKDDVVYMGTDTRIVIQGHKKNELCECDYKIQKEENGILVGITADKKIRQVIFAHSDIFTLDKKGKPTKKHIVNVVVPALIEILKKENLFIEEEGKLPYMNAEILLAFKGSMFEICKGFSVYTYQDFQAIGQAANYGQYTLLQNKNNEKEITNVNNVIIKALDVIAKHNCLVGRPYLLIDTKEQTYSLIEE